jgi:hypothetical protein
MIHPQLGVQFTEQAVPSSRSLQRWFRMNGCNRRRGRPSSYPAQVGGPTVPMPRLQSEFCGEPPASGPQEEQ